MRSQVFTHNKFLVDGLFSKIFWRSRAFQLRLSLEDQILKGSFLKLSENLVSKNGIVALVVSEMKFRPPSNPPVGRFDISNRLLTGSNSTFRFHEGFSLELPKIQGSHSPADLLWQLVISGASISDVIATLDISQLIGIESGK